MIHLEHVDGRAVVEYDHQSPFYAEHAPDIHSELRHRCPVAWSREHDGYWIVTGYDELATASRDDLTFSSTVIPGTAQQGVTIPQSGAKMPSIPIELDPPEFIEYRHLLNPYFSPAAVERTASFVDRVTTACLDEVVESGQIDFVHDLANPVTGIFTLKLLGLPLDEWERWSRPFHDLGSFAPGEPEFEAAVAERQWIGGRLMELAAERRAHPDGSGLLSDMAIARIDGKLLPLERVAGIGALVLAGGVDTTTALTANALNWLGVHPIERTRLTEEPSLIRSACEEFLRYFTPVQALARTATCPVKLGDQQIAAGERVLLSWAGANRDETVFPEPELLKIDRFPNRHAAFGLGAHRCIGSNFARQSFAAMVESVLRRISDYSIDPVAAKRNNSIGQVNGWVRLPAHFSPQPQLGGGSLAQLLAST